MNGPCESCHVRTSTQVLTFGADEPAFLVCDPCALVAEGYYGSSKPIDDEQLELPLGLTP